MATFRAKRSGFSVYPLLDAVIGVPFLMADGTWAIPANSVTAASGNPVTVEIEDIHELPKLSTDVFSINSTLYWDVANARLTIVATGNTPIGISVDVRPNPTSTGLVNLNAGVPKRVGFSKIKFVPLLTIPAGTLTSNTLAVGTEWNGAKVMAADIGLVAGTPDVTARNYAGVVSAGNLIIKSGVNATADTPVFAILYL